MKYEDVKKLEAGDKIVIRLAIDDVDRLNEILPNTDEKEWFSLQLYKTQILGKVSDFWQQKIRFTKAEKAEFDDIRTRTRELFRAFEAIGSPDTYYPHLKHWIKKDDYPLYRNDREILFAKAWYCPEWIQVEKEKEYYIKILGNYLVRSSSIELVNKKAADKFTINEILEMNSWPKFAEVDLTKCKEVIENEN
ncbi:hypothetical protein FC89_GL000297 [Liquorilactobacillus ghanensis DSM 18630]|uniref:Uncharacterized protein n=1 Tax=Liquorilactobacillus ghanensis DSM 18630 TaxID=1423750 RepID=A0A0R1VYQ4_9LACO|nr:hypothetical protein [Liquorilactobacillus ghanensis]KRM06988.1 hypothetical protein FC89_GL000297 [Liquorilactobacillus ghanensis DSM 18630]